MQYIAINAVQHSIGTYWDISNRGMCIVICFILPSACQFTP